MEFVAASAAIALGSGLAAASDGSLLSSCTNCVLDDEYDEVEREADVFLFCRKLADSALLKEADEDKYHHWALVIHFLKGDRWMTYEGFEVNLVLEPSCSNERPRVEGKYYYLENTIISPAKLRNLAQQNELNGTPYRAATRNCQEWVKKLATDVSDKVAERFKDFKTFKETNPFIADILRFSSASSNTPLAVSKKLNMS